MRRDVLLAFARPHLVRGVPRYLELLEFWSGGILKCDITIVYNTDMKISYKGVTITLLCVGVGFLGFGKSALAASASFSPAVDYEVGGAPRSITTGDFNADGIADLVTANFDTNDVSVLFGSGIGTFGTKTDYVAGTSPTSVITGDFNADDKIDLAVSNYVSNDISILLGETGGVFGTKDDYATGLIPHSVATGDFNDDGKIDLVATNGSSVSVSILLGNGDGAFDAKTDYPVGFDPRSVVTGDFNADDNIDIAVANSLDSTVSVLLGIGNGTFGAKTDYATDDTPRAVGTGDFNADGKADLVTANYFGENISILLGSGTGAFGAKTDYTTGSMPTALTIGDFNADGRSDVVVANSHSDTVSIFQGRGDGTFSPKKDHATGPVPFSVTTGDFNGDEQADIAVANYDDTSVSIFLNSTPTKPVVIKLNPKSSTLKIKVGSVTKTIVPFAPSYKGSLLAWRIKYSGTHSHYVILNSGPNSKGSIKLYDENGKLIETYKPFGKYAKWGMNADMIYQPSNGKIYLATVLKKIGYQVRIYEVRKSSMVKISDLAAMSKNSTGTILVKFLKLYGNDYGLVTIKSGLASTVKIWKYSPIKKKWIQDMTDATRAKIRVVHNKAVLR